jgi:hypothetical protein
VKVRPSLPKKKNIKEKAVEAEDKKGDESNFPYFF